MSDKPKRIVSNELSSAASSHRTYVEGVLRHYRENDIRPGDPNEGTWHKAHYPTPSCLGGTETIDLLIEHHAVQGVLQSEEFDHPSIFGWEGRYMPEALQPLFKKWKSRQAAHAGKACGAKAANAYWAAHPKKRKAQIKKSLAASHKAHEKPVLIEDTRDGHFMLFESINQAASTLSLCAIDLAKVARGVRKTISNKRYKANYA